MDHPLQVVIRVPRGLAFRHWVHGCQFLSGEFTMCRTSAQAAISAPRRQSHAQALHAETMQEAE